MIRGALTLNAWLMLRRIPEFLRATKWEFRKSDNKTNKYNVKIRKKQGKERSHLTISQKNIHCESVVWEREREREQAVNILSSKTMTNPIVISHEISHNLEKKKKKKIQRPVKCYNFSFLFSRELKVWDQNDAFLVILFCWDKCWNCRLSEMKKSNNI